MTQNKSLRYWIMSAIFAALYVVLTVTFAPISYGVLQFRLSEVLNHFIVFNRKLLLALTLGVFIANLNSPFGLLDIIVGSLTTFICGIISICLFKLCKKTWQRLLINTIVFSFIGMLPIALMITLTDNQAVFTVNYITLVLGELPILSISALLFYKLEHSQHFNQLFNQ